MSEKPLTMTVPEAGVCTLIFAAMLLRRRRAWRDSPRSKWAACSGSRCGRWKRCWRASKEKALPEMPQKETAPAADRGGEEVLCSNTTSYAKSGTKSQPCSDALDKVRKAMAPATPKISWRQILKVHPAADKVPVASDDERRRLRGDLCRNGLIEPVVLVRVAGGPLKLLDGRHRLDGLQDNGVEVINSDGDLLVSHKVLDLADDAAALRMVLSLKSVPPASFCRCPARDGEDLAHRIAGDFRPAGK